MERSPVVRHDGGAQAGTAGGTSEVAVTDPRREDGPAHRHVGRTPRQGGLARVLARLPPPRWSRWTTLRGAFVLVLLASATVVTVFEALGAWLLQWAWKTPPTPESRRVAALAMLLGGAPTTFGLAAVALLRQTTRWLRAALAAVALTVLLTLGFLFGPTSPGIGPPPVDVVPSLARLRDGGWARVSFVVFWGHATLLLGVVTDTVVRRSRSPRSLGR